MSGGDADIERIVGRLEKLKNLDGLKSAIEKGCALVERSAKQKAQKDTGALRRSITSKVTESDKEVQGVVYTPLEYGPYFEYGTGLFAENGNGRKDVPWFYKDDEGKTHITSGQHPHPFMRPAFDENKSKIKKLIKEETFHG